MGSVTVNTTALEVSERGEGEPLVLVHGSAGDHRTWQSQIEPFAERFRTIVYSRRYHWPNQPIEPDAEYTLDEHVEDLISLLSDLGGAPAHLVGHSYGGVVCLCAAMRAPKLVRSLVLTEPPVLSLFVSVPPKPTEVLASICLRPLTTAGIIKLGALGLGPATAAARRRDAEAVIRLTGRAILGPNAYAALSPERLQQVRDNTIFEELLSASFLPRLSKEEVAALSLPILLIGGNRSPFVFGRLLGELNGLLPNARRVLVQGASHLVHEDNPAQFNEHVLTFIDSPAVPRRG